jgi:hypothetical protein
MLDRNSEEAGKKTGKIDIKHSSYELYTA